MKAAIITIGDEILNGQIVDTNSPWIAQQLAPLHISISQILSIADTPEAIRRGLDDAAQDADIILVTGGLGPTKDDVTKGTIASYFDTNLVRNQEVLEHVRGIFAKFSNMDMPEINEQQADVLANAMVLFNDVGTAPGMAIEHMGKFYAFMPGVPFEMKFLMENRVLPVLAKYQGDSYIYNAYLLTVGIGESHLANKIADIEESLPQTIKLAYLPRLGSVLLRLTASGANENEIQETTEHFASLITDRVGDQVIARENSSLEKEVVRAFSRARLHLSTAESCTGGAIASSLTAIAGASEMFQGGAVVYSNSAKMEVLGVKQATLKQYGAVSELTVREMAEAAKKVFNSDYSIATSGIAGPGGGTTEKPVGMVCIAVAGRGETVTKTYQFKNDRAVNIERARMMGLMMLWNLFQTEQFLASK